MSIADAPSATAGLDEEALPDWSTFTLLSGLDAPLTARQAVADRAAAWLDDAGRFKLDLLLTEVVTNAVQHGVAAPAATIEVDLAVIGGTLGVEVANVGRPLAHEPGLPDELADGGRGPALVDALAERWGCRHEDGRTTVWFALGAEAAA